MHLTFSVNSVLEIPSRLLKAQLHMCSVFTVRSLLSEEILSNQLSTQTQDEQERMPRLDTTTSVTSLIRATRHAHVQDYSCCSSISQGSS